SGRVSVGETVGIGGAAGIGAGSTIGGGAGLANGRGAERRGVSRFQPTTPAITVASTPPPITTYTRFERVFERFASSHRLLRIVCIGGRGSGTLESASATIASREAGAVRRRCRIGAGVSFRCLASTASRVSAWNGGPPQSIS